MDADTQIVIWIENDILGHEEFWRGTSSEVPTIRSLPARELASFYSNDGIPRTSGMWRVGSDAGKETPLEMLKRLELRWARSAQGQREIFDKNDALLKSGTPLEIYHWLLSLDANA
jgi:hypothetical protein